MSVNASHYYLHDTNVHFTANCDVASHNTFEMSLRPLLEGIKSLVDDFRSKRVSTRPVIAISGCSGVGKTHLSKQLREQLQHYGIKSAILRFDDFLDPFTPFEGGISIHPHFDHLRAHLFLKEIEEGKERIEKPTWDETLSFKIVETIDLSEIELLIFEGEFVLCNDPNTYDFMKYSSLRLVLDAEDSDIIRWDWERNRHIDVDTFEEFEVLRKKALTNYRQIIEPLKNYADFMITKDDRHFYTLRSIADSK